MGVSLMAVAMLGCAVGIAITEAETPSPAEKTLPITVRDLELEFAEAQRAKLEFYSPRFFLNARRAYDNAQLLRRENENHPELQKYLDLVAHNLSRAYASKDLVLLELGGMLVQWEQLVAGSAAKRTPQPFKQTEALLTQAIQLLELKQVNSASWIENHAADWPQQRNELQKAINAMLGKY